MHLYIRTGVGAWCTVSVNVYNEEEEMERLKKEAEEEEENRYKKLFGNSKGKSILWGNDDEEDGALSVYDPNKTGVYKGFKIAQSSGKSSSLAQDTEPRVELSKPGIRNKLHLFVSTIHCSKSITNTVCLKISL